MIKVRGVGGVFFKADDPSKLCGWYRDMLGFDLAQDFNGAIFKPDQLPELAYLVWSPFEADTTYLAPSRKESMINLIVDDVAQALVQVREGGGTVIDEVQNTEHGVFGWFLDPEGNKIELWTPA